MRNAYEESVYIRTQKLKAAEGGFDALLPKLKPGAPVAGKKVAVIGGGPAGMSAAYFLGRAGVDVTVFERKDSLGGIVRHVIPAFRISDEAIDNDVKLMNAMGVKVELNCEVKSEPRRVVLLLASYLFFWAISGKLIAYLLFSTLSVHHIGLWLEGIQAERDRCLAAAPKEERKAVRGRFQRQLTGIVAFGVVLHLGLLLHGHLTFFDSKLHPISKTCPQISYHISK